jgi:Aerotolerance regulator N-terminal/von Willebrand factor type A domain
MSFLNPIFLSALAFVGVPLLIHLIRRRKQKVVKWAAMEFLRQSQKKQRRRMRIEELILLTLRILIVALAAMAFARPVIRAIGAALLSQNTRVYAVIVLDNSYSMGQRGSDGKTGMERAQAYSAQILTKILKAGDSASLVLLSDKPEALINSPSFDRDLVARRIKGVALIDRGTDYLATAQLVDKLLKVSNASVKEVYWLTDDQANGWANSKRDSARAVWQDMAKQARLIWVSAGAPPGNRDNLVVEAPLVGRELVTPQLPVRIEARIVNYGAKPRNDVLVNLLIDGRPAGSKRVSIAPGKDALASFPQTRFPTPGTHIGRIELADASHADSLERDNGANFVVRCRDRIKVLVQDMHPTSDPTKSDSFYLLNAMAPGGAQESLAAKLREGEGLGGVKLSDYDVVILTSLGNLSAGDRRALLEYVRAGGGLLLFPGAGTEATRVNADLGGDIGLLPARLTGRKVLSDEDAATLNPASVAHAALSMFKDTSSLNVASARFTQYFGLEPTPDAADPNAVQTMLKFSNGDPAFVERHVKQGRVILAASSAGSSWNQLPLKPSYVPLVYQLLFYLGQGATTQRNIKQEQPIVLALPLGEANKPVRVTTPDGRATTQNSSLGEQGVTFSYGATQQAGVYRVAVQGGKTQDAFAVNLPTEESDLTATDPAQAVTQTGFPGGKLAVATTPAQLQRSVAQARYGSEVWRPLVFAVIVLLFLEGMLAQLFGRRG